MRSAVLEQYSGATAGFKKKVVSVDAAITLTNDGVLDITGSPAISVTGSKANYTITNTGVTAVKAGSTNLTGIPDLVGAGTVAITTDISGSNNKIIIIR